MVITAVLWLLVGVLAGLWMARRGYSLLWALVAAPLGPLFLPIAAERVRRRPGVAETGSGGAPPNETDTTPGPRVLVGLDGSADSKRALATVLRLLRPQGGLLVLAEVIPFDSAEKVTSDDIDAASARLAGEAAGIDTAAALHAEVLTGPPGPALRRYAGQHDLDLLVVGRHGSGLSTRLLGSVSADLIENSSVPVLVIEPQNQPQS
jgi:nucleotide-binding universal stress UspA family protein